MRKMRSGEARMRYTCAACAAENEVLPPKGYRLVEDELEDGEDEEELEDGEEVDAPGLDRDASYRDRPSGAWDDDKDAGGVVDNPHSGIAGRSSDPRKASEAVRTFASRYGKLLRETRWFRRSKGNAPVVGLPNPSVDVVTGRVGGRR